jgi:hypothetical protein
MKKIIFITFLLITNISFAQNKIFSVEDGLIIWRYIYEDSTSISKLKSNPRLEFKTDSTGIIKKTNFSDKMLHPIVAEFKIEVKKNKYRVSVFNTRFNEEPRIINKDGLLIQANNEYTIEQALLKRNKTLKKPSLLNNSTETLNPHLIQLFTIKNPAKNDW